MTGPVGGSPVPQQAAPRRAAAVTTRGDRVRDMIALGLVLAGIVLILVSHAGMQRLATQPIIIPRGQPADGPYNHYKFLDYAGKTVVTIGIIVGIASYLVHFRRGRKSEPAS